MMSDSASSAVRAWALEVLAAQPRVPGGGVPDLLGRLCRAVDSGLGVAGAVVEIRSGLNQEAVAAVSNEVTRTWARLEFDLGEGPVRTAHACGRPVSVPDMGLSATGSWAGWGPAARAAGIEAVFAFPLRVGAAKFGVLGLYSAVPRLLDRVEFARCLAVAELATEILLASSDATTDGEIDPGLKGVLGFRSEVYQAQGAVAAALGIGLDEALARMRAHAFAARAGLDDVSLDIVAGRLRLSDDRT